MCTHTDICDIWDIWDFVTGITRKWAKVGAKQVLGPCHAGMVGPLKFLVVSTVCLSLALLTGLCEAAPSMWSVPCATDMRASWPRSERFLLACAGPHEVHIRHVRQGNVSDHGAIIVQRDLIFRYRGRGAITRLVLLVTNYNETGQLVAAWGYVDLGNGLYTLPPTAFPIPSGGSYGGWGYQSKNRFGLAKITVYTIVTVNDGTYQAPCPSPPHPASHPPAPSPLPPRSAVAALVSLTQHVVQKFLFLSVRGVTVCAHNPCGLGKCRAYGEGYTCACEEGSVVGAFSDGAPTCLYRHAAELQPMQFRPKTVLRVGGAMQFRPRRRRTGAVTCSLFDVVVEGDTCATLASFNNISLTALLAFNPRLNCTQPVVGFSACVGQEMESVVPSLTCGLMYPPQEEDTCESIMQDNLLTHTLFQRLNPGIVCNDFGGHQVCHGGVVRRGYLDGGHAHSHSRSWLLIAGVHPASLYQSTQLSKSSPRLIRGELWPHSAHVLSGAIHFPT